MELVVSGLMLNIHKPKMYCVSLIPVSRPRSFCFVAPNPTIIIILLMMMIM